MYYDLRKDTWTKFEDLNLNIDHDGGLVMSRDNKFLYTFGYRCVQ